MLHNFLFQKFTFNKFISDVQVPQKFFSREVWLGKKSLHKHQLD